MTPALPSVPSELPPDRGRYRPWLLGLAGLAVAATGVVVFRGCSIRQPPLPTDAIGTVNRDDPWANVLVDLRRQPDLNGARATLERLGTALAVSQKPDLRPAGLSDDGAALLKKVAGLTDAEVAEVRPDSYSAFDPHYVAECLALRDAVRGAEFAGLEPLQQAELAHAWTVRHVTPRLWIDRDDRGRPTPMPPVPPVVVLSRGFGTGLERAYVFLALLRQLGLDGCFVGPPEAADRPWSYSRDPAVLPVTGPTGPFWAVGVRVGADVYLFDPVRGEPVPGPGGKGVGTLAQVRANSDQLKPWRDDKTNPWTVPAADVSGATAFLAVPLSGLAPRFARLERELKADAPPVRLTVDLPALRSRFAAEAKLPDLPVWNPSNERFSFPRVLAAFVPVKDGGFSPLPDLPTQVLRAGLPPGLVPPGTIVGDVERLRTAVVNRYASTFLAPPTPRDMLARGAFAEAVPLLVGKLREFQAGQDRLRNDRALFDRATTGAFVDAAQEVDAKKRLARDKERDATGPLTQAAVEAEEALYKQQGPVAAALVDQALADAGAAEATYLLARAMHEQAERAAVRAAKPGAKPADREAAAQDWRESVGWWEQYAAYAADQDRVHPGRAAAAKRQADRATLMDAAGR